MKTLSQHAFMEVILKKLHNNVDKFATLNQAGDAIRYTVKAAPRVPRSISLMEGQRIFEDLYGDIATRWDVSPEFVALQKRKDRAARRKAKSAARRA